jgi:hypothetical protein
VAPLSGKAATLYRFESNTPTPTATRRCRVTRGWCSKRRGEIFLYETPMTMMPLDLGKFSKGRTTCAS